MNVFEEKKHAVDVKKRRVVSKIKPDNKAENGKKTTHRRTKGGLLSVHHRIRKMNDLVCWENYGNSRPREKWVQCFNSNHWTHEECTPGDAYYVCRIVNPTTS